MRGEGGVRVWCDQGLRVGEGGVRVWCDQGLRVGEGGEGGVIRG